MCWGLAKACQHLRIRAIQLHWCFSMVRLKKKKCLASTVISFGRFLHRDIVKLEADRNSAFSRSLLRALLRACARRWMGEGRKAQQQARGCCILALGAPASWHLPWRNYFSSAEKLTAGNCALPFLTEARFYLWEMDGFLPSLEHWCLLL